MSSTFPRSALTASAVLLVALAGASSAYAQSTSTTPPANPPAKSSETRPATTTFFGDTGLWYVPTAEVLPAGKVSVSGYRRGTNYIQGYTNVGDFAGTLAVGIKDRAELFTSFLVDTRIERDSKPVFFNDAKAGGVVDRYPMVNQHWTGNNIGDWYIGGKLNLTSEADNKPVAFALKVMAKIPTGKKDIGVSTGKLDTSFDAIISKEVNQVIELSAFGGYEFRGKPDGFETPSGAFRWGAGAGSPSRFPLRAFAELGGFMPSDSTMSITTATLVGVDNTRPPTISDVQKIVRLTFGLTYQAKSGFFFGVGGSQNLPRQDRTGLATSEGKFGDYTDWQLRIGYHPGVRVYVAPAPPPPPPPPTVAPPPPPPVHTLSVKASCSLCSVEVNKTDTVTATVTDSMNCAVTYQWSAPAGTFTNATARVTPWTAPGQPGSVPVTVTVTCPTDGLKASDTVNINVTQTVVKTYAFDDVYFDFDRSTLRPDALRILDGAVSAMQADSTLNLTIEGNTCNIGTAEYNLALGERRANVVRDYLVSRGITASRLRTVSYGEERPKYDNEREETRRLNRRAVLVVDWSGNSMSNQMKAVMNNWMRGLAMLGIVIGTVHIPKAAVANGAGLPAGTYTMRVADDQQLTVPAGQSPDSEKWVEFVQGGKVVAKEVASVVTDAVMASEVADRGRPKPGQTWLQTLKGGDYYRVWVNKGGTRYLVNLAIGKPVVK